MTSLPSTITFHFDPSCPWTWATHQWLLPAATAKGVEVQYSSLSLGVLNKGNEIPEQYRAPMEAGARAHRVFASLGAAGRQDLVRALYVEFGRRTHHDGEMPSAALVAAACEAAGVPVEHAAAADDPAFDDAVERSTAAAIALAGPDVGSPVLSWGDPEVGTFGPIVSPPPSGADGERLLELVVEARSIPGFFELKRGRSAPVDKGTRP